MNTTDPNHLINQLKWRYATKQFDPAQKIPTTLWDSIEESLVLTPSSFGLQPWHFLVITDEKTREQLLPHSWNQTQVTDCSHFIVIAAQTTVGEKEVNYWLETLSNTQGRSLEELDGYRQMMIGFLSQMSDDERLHWAKLQTYIALGQVMSTAAQLGIDACPMEGFVPVEYDQILGLAEKNLAASVACAFGYRSQDDKYASTPKARYARSELITQI